MGREDKVTNTRTFEVRRTSGDFNLNNNKTKENGSPPICTRREYRTTSVTWYCNRPNPV